MRRAGRLLRLLRNVPVLLVIAFLVFGLSVTGCALRNRYPAGTVKKIEERPFPPSVSAILDQQAVVVPPLAAEEPPSPVYIVGPGDVLYINLSGKTEFGSPSGGLGSKVQGSRVGGNGNIQLPLIGTFQAGGFTVEQIQAKLVEAYSKYIKEPWVVVEVAEYRSQPLYLLGQFRSAGTHYMDIPMDLLRGIALGGGLDPSANLRGARLIRGKKTMAVDIYALLLEGDQSQNVWLKPGDTIYVPDSKAQNVYVFGAVKTVGPISMEQGRLTLSQAIAHAGLPDTGFHLDQVRIIRSLSATRGQLIVVDAGRIMRGETLPLSLAEGDIVYVPKSRLKTWNDALNEILPLLNAFGAILNPFVQIKFLSD
ncbi:MAG: polysaccharide biosynthesis/export family protein [Candidatus Deferrimicrobiaceae bacterium]